MSAAQIYERAINKHLPQDQLRILQIAEEDERRQFAMWANEVRR